MNSGHIGRCTAALAIAALGCAAPAAHAGLLAFYDFNGSAADRSGNGFNATAVSATLTLAGYEGQAYDFNGSSDSIGLPLDINPSVLPRLTMGAWVNLDVASSPSGFQTQAIISHDNGGFDRTLNQDLRGGTGSRYSSFAGSTGVLGGSPVVVGAWTFVAVRYDQAAATVVLDVDATRYTRSAATLGVGNTFTLLGSNPGFGEFLNGRIDNVFFYDEVLSDARIAAIRAGGANAIVPVPEPASWALMAIGAVALATRVRANGKPTNDIEGACA